MSHFHKKITYDNDANYKIVNDDLYKSGVLMIMKMILQERLQFLIKIKEE